MQDPLTDPMVFCVQVEVINVGNGESVLGESTCFGDAFADPLGLQILDPAVELAGKCEGPLYTCGIIGGPPPRRPGFVRMTTRVSVRRMDASWLRLDPPRRGEESEVPHTLALAVRLSLAHEPDLRAHRSCDPARA